MINYKEISKLYPEIKIPVLEFSEYYVKELKKTNSNIDKILLDYENFPDKENLKSIKQKFMYEVINFLEPYKEKINEYLVHDKYQCLEFNDFKPGKFYVSLDLKEANFQSLKVATGVKEETWKDFIIKNFHSIPSLLVNSKSLRQFIFGNINPKKFQKIQENMMYEIFLSLHHSLEKKIVSKKSDEIIFEFDNEFEIAFLNGSNFKYELKQTNFTISIIQNFNDIVKIKNTKSFLNPKKEIINSPGNRFFLHYKTLILKEELCVYDLCFKVEANLAEWKV